MQNHVNPAMDFTQTPPGMLAVDNMLYLAKVHQDTYIRVSFGFSHLSEVERSVRGFSLPLLTDRPGEQQPWGQTRMPFWPLCHRAHQDVVRDTPGWRIAWVQRQSFSSCLINPQLYSLCHPHHNFKFYNWSIFLLLFFLANEGCNDYHPMFFTHDRAWEEFFCVCIQLLNKTWKEMRATAEDFNKVAINPLNHA